MQAGRYSGSYLEHLWRKNRNQRWCPVVPEDNQGPKRAETLVVPVLQDDSEGVHPLPKLLEHNLAYYGRY